MLGQKTLNMCHQAQKSFCNISVGFPQHQKGYLVYAPRKWKIVSLHDVVLITFSRVHCRTRHNHIQKLCICVSYIPYATSSRGGIGDIITFVQFEDRNSLSETRNNTESGNKS